MFGKKKDATNADSAESADGDEIKSEDIASAPPLKPFSRKGSHAPAKPPTATSFQPEIPHRKPEIPGLPVRQPDRALGPVGNKSDANRLIVGRDIRMSGEITACDKLVVEGRVEVNLSNARVIEVAPTGHFTGTAEVDEADISGRYDGDLIAREKLIVRAGGHIKGKVSYGRIVIESGGEVSGDMQTVESPDGDA
ncbi:MAG: polymer-forming cytoskeletal protein [Rhodospirillales bacterium]|nr:polymer-forming cytoskeletal protein [Rhodospirillales bacterium]